MDTVRHGVLSRYSTRTCELVSREERCAAVVYLDRSPTIAVRRGPKRFLFNEAALPLHAPSLCSGPRG